MKQSVLIFIMIMISVSTALALSDNDTENTIINYVKQSIKNNNNVDSLTVKLYSPQSRIENIKADEITDISPLDSYNIKYQRFQISYSNGTSKKVLTVTLELEVFASVAVPGEQIFHGEENFSHKIIYKIVDVTQYRNIYSQKEDFKGKRALSNLQAGIPVTQNSVREIPHVSKDALITVIYERNSIVLSFETEALRDGYIGERVHFRNPFDKQIRFGTVIALNRVIMR